jgi:uncharacterized repeat protein (TIGR01451 family)
VGPTPDLLVAKYPQTYRAGSGQLYDYYIIYRNAGGGLAQSVIITDDLPAGVSYVSFEPSGGQPAPVVTGTRVVWQLPAPVAYKRSTTSLGYLRVRVNPGVQTGALLTNVVRISTASSEPARDNNIYTDTLEVAHAADLYVYKYLTSGTPAPGRLVTFTVSAGNGGTVTATQVVVTDLLPAHATFVTATAPAGWIVTRTGSLVTWTTASLAADRTASLLVVAQINPGAPVGGQITNTVAITGAAAETYVYDNSDEYGFTIAPLSADVWVRKALPLTIGPNERLETVIYYSNGGLETAWSVFFTDTLPVGVSGARWNDCPVTPNANRELWWLLGRMNYQGYSSSLGRLSFVAPPTAGVVLTNVVRVGSITPEYTTTNNTSVATTTVQLPSPPRSVTVTGPREGMVGQVYNFTATVGPVTTTLPLTYTWRATERHTNTHASQSSLQDVTYMYWFTPGVKLITVTVTNITGTVTGTHAITVSQPAYSLTVHIVGQGVVTRTPDQATYLAGTPVQLIAGPAAAWRFVGWSGDLAGTANPDTIVMNSNKVVTATFLSSGTSAQIVPGAGGGLTYTDAQGLPTAVRIGPGGVTETIYLSFVPRELAHLTPPLPAGWGYGRHAFALVVYRGGQAVTPYGFAGPISITVGYSDQDIARLREDTLQLRYLDAGGQWQDAAATCNPPNAYIRDLAGNRLTARVCRAAEFALAGVAKSLAFVPITLK